MYGSMVNKTVKAEECKKIEDIHATVHCTIADIFHGTVKTVTYIQEYPNSQQLILTREVNKKVIIAPGANENHKMKFKGEGNIGFEHGQQSDLIVQIKIKKDDVFSKKDSDLIMTYEISLGKALNCESLRFNIF